MKKAGIILLVGLLLCSCAAAPSSTAGDSVSHAQSESRAQLPNPLVPAANAKEINAAARVNLACPVDAADVQYFILDGDVAQINFTLADADYVLRGSLRGDDIAGVYDTAGETVTVKETAVDGSVEVELKGFQNGSLAHWIWGDAQYTLYSRNAGIDAATIVRMACVAITQSVSTPPADAKAYLQRIYQADARPERSIKSIEVIEPDAYETAMPNGNDIDKTIQNPHTGITWSDFLTRYDSAQLLHTAYSLTGMEKTAQTADGEYERYSIVAQAENGSYYVAVRSM